MKIAYLTAGTGNFYCGTCLRDHTLMLGLRELGHEVTILPLYLPLVTEEPEKVSETIFMGGINAYLQQKFQFFRRSPAWLDKLLNSRSLLKTAARFTGMTKPRDLGEITLSTLRGEDGFQAKEFAKIIEWLKHGERPDVVCLSNALLTGFSLPIKRELAVPVVCTLQGEDTYLDRLPAPYRDQCWAMLSEWVRDVDGYVAVSAYHGQLMAARMSLPDDKLHIVHNGIHLGDFLPRPPREDSLTIGYLAALIPDKGLETLVDAFLLLKRGEHGNRLRLHVAGSTVPSGESFVRKIQKKIQDAGHEKDFLLIRNLTREEKLRFLSGLTLFSVPATYGESFGLYVIEALAAGVPVVQPDHAAFPEILGITGGGVLCQPNSPESLAQAMANLLTDLDHAERLGGEGRDAVVDYFNAARMCREFAQVLESTKSLTSPAVNHESVARV